MILPGRASFLHPYSGLGKETVSPSTGEEMGVQRVRTVSTGSQSSLPKVLWPLVGQTADPSCQQANIHLGSPHGESRVGPCLPSHSPGGQAGPSLLLPLWVQLTRLLLGLLLVLWDPESHKNKGSVGLSRHSPFLHSNMSQGFGQARPDHYFLLMGPCLQPRWQMH